jgi:hypothetical protein
MISSILQKFIYLFLISLTLVFFTAQEYGYSQENEIPAQTDTVNNGESSFSLNGGLSADVNPFWTPEETAYKKGMRYSILIGFPLAHIVYGVTVWNWGENSDWKWANERWFQGDTDSGGADKTGHFFAHYLVSRASYSFFSYTEKNQNVALTYSALTAAGVGVLIEVGDAYTGKYGFSYEDIVADFLGVAAAVVLDKYPVADEFIGITATYWPSKGFKKDEDSSYGDFAGDYSGWKYLMNLKLAGFKYIGFDIPEFMRYIQLDLGYYTREYTDYDLAANPSPEPKRHWSFGASVNMREVTRDIFRNHKTAGWVAEQPFKYYHVPIGFANKKSI